MKRGIFRYGIFKAFLTRGLFRKLFKPLLYSKTDKIHDEFISVLNKFTVEMNKLVSREGRAFPIPFMFWLVIVPKEFFEAIFIEDEKNNTYLDVVRNATTQNGSECSYLTQAFVLWNLQQFLENDKGFRQKMGFSIEDVEKVVTLILGKENKVIHYLNYLREKFDTDKLEIDPRDWSFVYVAEVAKLLINDKQVLTDTLQEWDNDLIQKMEFISFETQFFLDKKNFSMGFDQD